MTPAILELIQGTHAGIVKCKQRARETLNWPGMRVHTEEKVKDRITCHDYAPVQKKDPKSCPRSASGNSYVILAFDQEQYLVLVDYYSKYIEVN